MHPTTDEQLAGARRLIDLVRTTETLSPASQGRLDDAARILRRVEATWSALLPFLSADNEATAELLGELTDRLPEELAATAEHELAAALAEADGDAHLVFDVVHARNQRLRALLDAAIPHLDQAGRRRVADHLRRRIDLDPTLTRAPRRL